MKTELIIADPFLDEPVTAEDLSAEDYRRSGIAEELNEGKALAGQLVEHLNSMGATSGTIPIMEDGIEYKVTVERVEKAAEPGESEPVVSPSVVQR